MVEILLQHKSRSPRSLEEHNSQLHLLPVVPSLSLPEFSCSCKKVQLSTAQRERTMTGEQNRGLDGKKERAMAGGKKMVVNQQNGLTLQEISTRRRARAVVPFLILQDQDSIYSNLRPSLHLGRDKLNPVVWSVRIQAMHVGPLHLWLSNKWSSESLAPKLCWHHMLKEYQFWCVRFEWFKRPSIYQRAERGRRGPRKRPGVSWKSP